MPTLFVKYISNKMGFEACYPKLNTKGGSLDETLDDFVHAFGAPEHLTFNGFQSQVGKNTKFSRIFANIILITMYLHRDNPMKSLQKALSEKSSVDSIE